MSTCFPKERCYQLLTELEQEREARQQAEAIAEMALVGGGTNER